MLCSKVMATFADHHSFLRFLMSSQWIRDSNRFILKALWNRSRTAHLHFWIPDPVFKAQTWLVNPASLQRCDQAIFSRLCSRWLRCMVCDTRDRSITRWKVDMMAHDPAVVNIKRGGRCPGAGLVLANFLHYNNTQRTRLALSAFTRCSIL